jgi:hypothetical protein
VVEALVGVWVHEVIADEQDLRFWKNYFFVRALLAQVLVAVLLVRVLVVVLFLVAVAALGPLVVVHGAVALHCVGVDQGDFHLAVSFFSARPDPAI